MATKTAIKSKTEIIESALYGDTVKVSFYPKSHMYKVNGERVTGVTTIIGIKDKSAALQSWQAELTGDALMTIYEQTYSFDKGVSQINAKHILESCYLHEKRKEEAADLGTKIHDWVEQYIKSTLGICDFPDMPEEKAVQIGVNAFMDWAKAHNVKFLSSERIVYSKKHHYIGQMDIEAIIDGKLCLVDLKSSNGLYNAVLMQTAAYLMADEEESGHTLVGKKKYDGRWAIRLSKETEQEYITRLTKKNKWRELRGLEPKEIPPYQVFEAKNLDIDSEGKEVGRAYIERDFEAFLNFKAGFEWNKETDFYLNGR